MAFRYFVVLAMLVVEVALHNTLAATNAHVILITIDGFPAYMLNDPLAPIPTLRRLAKEGAVATNGMRKKSIGTTSVASMR